MFPVLFALLLTVSCGQFDVMKQRIQETGLLNTNSIGKPLTQVLYTALQVNDSLKVSSCSFQITNTSMQATCASTVWGATVQATWVVYTVPGALAMSGQFNAQYNMPQLITRITKKPAPAWVWDIQQGFCSFSFASAPGSPLNLPVGISIAIHAANFNQTGDNTLLKTYQRVLPGNQESVDVTLFIPIFSQNPFDISLSAVRTGIYPLSKTVALTKVTIKVSLPSSYFLDVQFFVKIKTPPPGPGFKMLYFDVNGSISDGPLVLSGALMYPWAHPLGFKWLQSIDSASLTVTLGQSITKIVMTAVTQFSFSSSPITLLISLGGDEFGDILFAAENINCDKGAGEIYTFFTGKQHQALSQVQIKSTGTLAIATYSTATFQEGITFMVDTTLTDGLMRRTAQKLSAQGASFEYIFTIYIPFGNLQLDLTLQEITPFQFDSRLTIESYQYILDIGGGASKFELEAKINALLSDKQTLQLDVSATIQEGSGLVFLGTTLNVWVHPFGMKWMNLLSGASVSLILDNAITFKLHGDANLTWSQPGLVNFDVQIGGAGFEQNVISLNGIPIKTSTLDKVIKEITGKSSDEVKALNAQGTYAVTLATFDSQFGKRGLTLETKVSVTDQQSAIYKALSLLQGSVSNILFDVTLYVPLFDNPLDIWFDLTETGKFKFNDRITIDNYGLHVHVEEMIEVTAGMDIKFKDETLHFDTLVEFNIQGESFIFQGDMTGNWVAPYGCKWLTITNLKLALTIGLRQLVQEFAISGAGNYVWGPNDKGSATISLTCDNDFTSDTLSFTINNQWTIYKIVQSMAGNGVSALVKEVEETHNLAVDFTLSTSSGITLQLDASVTGSLKGIFDKHLYLFPNKPGDSYSLFINIPIFSSNPLAITLGYQEKENTQVSKHLWFQGFKFSLSVLGESVSLDAVAIGKWNNNPPLSFEVSGQFSASAGLVLWGDMMGTWENAFGFKGFNLSNVIAQIGFSPAACSFGCLSEIGLGAEFNMGSTVIAFDGNLAVPDFWNMFLSGLIKRSPNPKSMAVLDVCTKWNNINPATPVSTKDIPSNWALKELAFYLAPIDGTFGPIHYTKGFGVTAIISLLQSMDVEISLNCSGDTFSCDFAFHTVLSVSQVEKLILKEITGLYPNRSFANNATYTFFKLHDVQLTQWSQANVAAGINPHWNYKMTIFNSDKDYGFHCDQYWMSHSFNDYFNQWLKHLF